MAVYKNSIRSRYETSDFTASDDNTADFVALDTKISLGSDGHTITIGNAGNTAADVITLFDITAGDYIIFNKRINITPHTRCNANAENGVHFWFVNCIIHQEGAGADGRQFLGPNDLQSGNQNGTRDDEITGTKADDISFNYYGCTFIHETDDFIGVAVFGDIEDCDSTILGDNTNSFAASPILQPMVGSNINGLVINGQTKATLGVAPFIFNDAGELNGLVLNNVFPYVGSGSDINLFEYEAGGHATRFSSAVKFLIADNGSGITMTNPKTRLATNGDVAWRGSSNNSNIIQRQRFSRKYYKSADISASNGRDSVKIAIETNATFSDFASQASINTSSATRTTFTYETDSDGIPEGTIDINDATATVTKTDFEIMDIPVQTLFRNTGGGNVETADGKTEYHRSGTFNFTVNVYEMSLWGSRWANHGKNGGDIVRTTADANGYFIAGDEETVIDGNDPAMVEYAESSSAITSTRSANGSAITLNDIYANIKLETFNDGDYTDWSDDMLDGTTFDFTAASGSRDSIQLLPGYTSDGGITLNANDVVMNAPEISNHVLIDATDGYVTGLKIDNLSVHSLANEYIRILGGEYEFTKLEDLEVFDSVPGADDYSAKDATMEGTIEVSVASGTTEYMKLENVTIESGKTLTINNTGSGNLEVIYSGTNDGTLTLGSNVTQKLAFAVKLTGVAEDFVDANLVIRAATSDSDTVGSFFSKADSRITATGNNTDREIDITVLVDHDETHLWMAICYDEDTVGGGYDPVVLTNTETLSHTIAMTQNTMADWDGTVSDVTAGDWDLSDVTVAAIGSSTANISPNWNDTTGSTFSTATDVQTRYAIRKYVIESSQYMDAMAQGFVDTDFFSFDVGQITVPTAQTKANNRLNFSHTADVTHYFRFASRLLNRDLTEDFTDDAGTGVPNTDVQFAKSTNGASIIEVQAIVDAQSKDLFGTPSGGTDRTLSDVYKKANLAAALSA